MSVKSWIRLSNSFGMQIADTGLCKRLICIYESRAMVNVDYSIEVTFQLLGGKVDLSAELEGCITIILQSCHEVCHVDICLNTQFAALSLFHGDSMDRF